jgi:hypothetical protein
MWLYLPAEALKLAFAGRRKEVVQVAFSKPRDSSVPSGNEGVTP